MDGRYFPAYSRPTVVLRTCRVGRSGASWRRRVERVRAILVGASGDGIRPRKPDARRSSSVE